MSKFRLSQNIMQAEIEKVKKRREERAIEKARHEEEMVSLLICMRFLDDLIVLNNWIPN